MHDITGVILKFRADNMSMKSSGTPALMIVMLLFGAALLLINLDTASGEEEDQVRLYLGNPQRLSTTAPPLSPQGTLATFGNGESSEYILEYPLAHDMKMEGSVEGGAMVLTMHIEGFNAFGSTPSLTVELYEDPVAGSSIKIAGTELGADELSEELISIPFQSIQGHGVEKGSDLRLVLEYSETGGIPGMTFFYISPAGNPSYIEFRTTVFLEDAASVQALDGSGNPIEAIIPYGPQEAREVLFSSSVMDTFGAYDVSSVSMVMTSSVGNILFNSSTDEPDPDGGEPVTYFNYTFEIPEGTPTDTYTITATAESHTGAVTEASMELEIAPGLFVQLDEAELGVNAGDVAIFSLEVLNGGDGTDRVSFRATSSRGWTVDVPPDIEIEGGETEILEFKVYVPLRAQSNDMDTLTFTATSRNAGKDYQVDGVIEVLFSASYGIEPVGDVVKSVMAGQKLDYQFRILNLVNSSKEFEISAENVPVGWDVSYDAPGGEYQGVLYMFEINASGEVLVGMTVDISDSGPFGRSEFSVYVRAVGETDRKYLYLTANVVDETREVVDISSGTSRKTAQRTGTGYPVTYGKVYFSLELYNPTLESLGIALEVDAPPDWDAEFDYLDIDLDPGHGSSWNLSIVPEAGTPWQGGSPYFVDVGIEAGDLGEFSERLEVVIPKVTVINVQREWETLNVVVGDIVPFNITFNNRGNHPEDIHISFDLPAGLEMNYTAKTIAIAPGGSRTLRGELTISEVEKMGIIGFNVQYETSKGTTVLDYSLKVSEREEENDLPIMTYIAIAAGVVIAVAAAFLIYLKFFSGGGSSSEKKAVKEEPEKRRGGVTVKATSPRPGTVSSTPTEESDVIKEADDILSNILGEEGESTEQEFEVVDVKDKG